MNKKINTEGLDGFFLFISKEVIIIPVFILIISLFLKFNQTKTGLNNQIPKVETSNLGVSTKNDSFKFNLKGPIVCEALFIKDKKILLKNKITNYLLNGDCLFTWETGKLIGIKKCGLSNYIDMAESYLGFLSVDDLINNNLVKDKIKNKDIDLAKVIKSCKREEIKDKNIFEIPKKILFEVK